MKKGVIQSKVPETNAGKYIAKKNKHILTKIVAVSPELIPKYETPDAACCDLRANLPDGSVTIGFMETKLIDTGIKIQMPSGYEAQIRCRSGLAKKGIMITNGIGTIDEGFRGTLGILLTNTNKNPYIIEHLARIAQMSIKPVLYFNFEQVDTIDITERNEGGFGSTGEL